MTRVSRGFGVVTLAALDLRRRPDHRSELRSQLLMGETVRILDGAPEAPWLRVENHYDGYEGWVRSWGVVRAPEVRVQRWREMARARVTALFAEVRVQPGSSHHPAPGLRPNGLVGPLFWQARVIAGRAMDGFRKVEFPDGRRGWVDATALESGGAHPTLEDRVRGLLGIPYLWGGRTPAGLDCSGFTQLLLSEQGVAIPRDADQQHRATQPVTGFEKARMGDLIFFAPRGRKVAHVGLWLGDGVFAHARGTVRIGSVEKRSPFYEKELYAQVRNMGRPVPGPRSGPS